MHVMQIRLKQVFGLRPLQQLDVDVHGEVISAGVAREPGRAGARYTEAAQSPVRLRTHHGRVFLRKLSGSRLNSRSLLDDIKPKRQWCHFDVANSSRMKMATVVLVLQLPSPPLHSFLVRSSANTPLASE
jgi:hypothetical protein